MKMSISTTIAMLIIGITSVCLAQDNLAGNSPPAGKAAARKKANAPASSTRPSADADAKAPATPLTPAATAQLRAKVHRTIAALVEAQAAEKPNEAKIRQLRQQLQTMQTKLQCPQGADFAGQCPMGGMGRGQGMGYGRGRGMGMGMGQGQCYGQGQGQGRGMGMGQGQRYGQGRGQAQGQGRGQGQGRMQGRGGGRRR